MVAEIQNSPQAWSGRASAPTSWEAAGWTRNGQLSRFYAILSTLNPQPGERMLDWGCGVGALCKWVPNGVRYHGFDWASALVDRARRENPEASFSTRPPSGFDRFDVVACVGPFNLPDGWSKEHTWHTLRHLWDTTECRALAVSLYSGADERCLVYTEAEVEKAGRDLSWNWRVIRHRPNDLLLAVRR